MAQSTINRKSRRVDKNISIASTVAIEQWISNAEHSIIAADKIQFSPLNYRKFIDEENLQSFAAELIQHGIISALLVRPIDGDKYELVAGERRLRAARIADIKTVPVLIASLTDEQVIELQLAENLQREDPHPLHEAQAMGAMQMNGKTIAEISARLGRKPSFIYARLRLLQLIEPFQEMLFAEILTLSDCSQIAGLAAASQTELFEARCSGWKKQKGFRLNNLEYYIDQYRYDLKSAPFNTKDKALIPEVGACSNCQYNSSTLKTLFPDEAKQAVCSNKECYALKCNAQINLQLVNAVLTYQPKAWIHRNELPEHYQKAISSRQEWASLPQYNFFDITVIEEPEAPDEIDYMYDCDEDCEEEDQQLNESEWAEAQADYQSQVETYLLHVSSGHYQVAILVYRNELMPVYFNLDKPQQQHRQAASVMAKQVQEAIKSGTVTPELLKAEIERLKQREKRNAELDLEKVQMQVHEQFTEKAVEGNALTAPTDADLSAVKFLLYDRLTGSGQHKVSEWLFPGREDLYRISGDELYERLSSLKPQEFTALIRVAIADKSESKYPSQAAGLFLYKAAEQAGLPVATIEQSQQEKAENRRKKLSVRVTEIEKKIKKVKSK